MEKIVQIITIPLDKDGWEKGDITLCVDMIMSSAESIGTMKIATYDYPAPNPYHEAQQLLVLSDDEIQLGDRYLDDCNQIRQCVVAPEVKIYWDVRKNYKKIIASYPHIEGTLPLSKETIQQWIDNGTPGEGSVDMNHWCKDGTSVSACERNCDCIDYPEAEIDPQGNLILEFEQQTLETAARDAAKSGGPFSTHGQNYEYMFKLGAEWQKQQLKP